MSESNINMNENSENSEDRGQDTWKNAFKIDLLLFGSWMTPKSILNENINYDSKKTTILATLFMILSSLLISIVILGIIDGPEMVTSILKFNFTIHSAFLYGWVIYSLILIWLIFMGMGWLLPLLIRLVINSKFNADEKNNIKKMHIASCYGVLSILFYVLVVYAFGLLFNGSNPQMVHLDFISWQNALIYVILFILLISIHLNSKLSGKILNYSEKYIKIEAVTLFLSLVACVAGFYLV